MILGPWSPLFLGTSSSGNSRWATSRGGELCEMINLLWNSDCLPRGGWWLRTVGGRFETYREPLGADETGG